MYNPRKHFVGISSCVVLGGFAVHAFCFVLFNFYPTFPRLCLYQLYFDFTLEYIYDAFHQFVLDFGLEIKTKRHTLFYVLLFHSFNFGMDFMELH